MFAASLQGICLRMSNNKPRMSSMPTVELVRELFNYDSDTGHLTSKVDRYKFTVRVGDRIGTKNNCGYLICRVNYKILYVHRLVWLHYHGEAPTNMLDHVNGDRADNRICNLRLADYTKNGQNRLSWRNLKGANFSKANNKWKAAIIVDSKFKHLGYFATEIEAHKAYIEAADKYHGEFAKY